MVNLTPCSKLEEETYKEGVSKGNWSEETKKTVDALEAVPVGLN